MKVSAYYFKPFTLVRSAMKLVDLIEGLETLETSGDLSTEITSLEYDSRKAAPGSLFIAVRGITCDGNSFIPEAVENGSVAIVTDKPGIRTDVPALLVRDARKTMALIADLFYGSPQNSLVMTGVTGTNGKTTTAYMIKSIFDASGLNCGLIGTINHIIGKEEITSVNTTPESPDIHRFLSLMTMKNQNACIMEVSSHALALSRVYGIQFRAAAFTNISRDHLDFHGDIKTYLEAKGRLFSNFSGDSTAVINLDDPHADYIIGVARGGNILSYGFKEDYDIHPVSYELKARGTEAVVSTPSGELGFYLPIPGTFNISNAMAAIGIGLACSFSTDTIARGLESMRPVRGRYELIDEGQDFTVIVDYAHTPDALERILTSAREIKKGRLISVFGCGGDRDRGKRPEMGEISARYADYTIVTSDNPRTENPDTIISEILTGIPEKAEHKKIIDRGEGIKEALKIAERDDTVVIAGKGHEDYQIIGNKRYHFDDAETVRRLLKAME